MMGTTIRKDDYEKQVLRQDQIIKNKNEEIAAFLLKIKDFEAASLDFNKTLKDTYKKKDQAIEAEKTKFKNENQKLQKQYEDDCARLIQTHQKKNEQS